MTTTSNVIDKRCKNCRFYTPSVRICARAEWKDMDVPVQEDTLTFYAHASDEQGLDAGIRPGPEFGCVLFTQKKA